MLVSLSDILQPFLARNAAVGAFNATMYADAEPILTAAEKLGAPVIVQVGSMAASYMDFGYWGLVLGEMARRASVPVCVHLDHAKSIEPIKLAIDSGFSGVMIDGSQLSYEDNVALTREVVKLAHPKGVSVEAEIGSVAYKGTDSHKAILSEPDEVARFVRDTKIDAVAVAVGTLHRMEKQASHIDFDRLSSIEKAVSIPLVIHGSSGLLDDEMVKLHSTRVCKINIGTALRIAFNDALRKTLNDNPDNYVYSELMNQPKKAVEALVTEKLKLLGF